MKLSKFTYAATDLFMLHLENDITDNNVFVADNMTRSHLRSNLNHSHYQNHIGIIPIPKIGAELWNLSCLEKNRWSYGHTKSTVMLKYD